MSVPYAASETVALPDDESILELTDGENPLTFLSMDEPDTALGVIAWMDDHDRIEGWRRAEIESDGEPRKIILKALEKQKRALEANATLPVYHDRHRRSTQIADAPTPDTTTDPTPVAATDGGTVTEPDTEPETDDPDDADDSDTEPEADAPTETHPDCKGLEAGEVLVLERTTPTEYIFPATADADAPYLHTTGGDAEPITFDRVLAKLEGSPDPAPADEIDVQPPTDAATGGGA